MAEQDPVQGDAEQPEDRNIRIFMRIKPVKRPGDGLTLNPDEGQVEFITPKASQGWVLVSQLARVRSERCTCSISLIFWANCGAL